MILGQMNQYNQLVKEIKALEPGEERVILIEQRPIIVRLVDDEDIRRLREQRIECMD